MAALLLGALALACTSANAQVVDDPEPLAIALEYWKEHPSEKIPTSEAAKVEHVAFDCGAIWDVHIWPSATATGDGFRLLIRKADRKILSVLRTQ
ncbi:hypothetical protein [Sphingomonas sp.]|uniref:hypothetical protein n=1 Tax=Sphingomonas sp. TaxID=28214 RepID=UPI0035C7C145